MLSLSLQRYTGAQGRVGVYEKSLQGKFSQKYKCKNTENSLKPEFFHPLQNFGKSLR